MKTKLMDLCLVLSGTYVDKRIMKGWQYKVRALGNCQKLFGGHALTLQSIGMGYGKRITFESAKLNVNMNYFWSDSQPEGYAFSLEVLHNDTTFHIHDDDDRQIGTAYVEAVDVAQTELSTNVNKKGCVTKKVAVTFCCLLQYGADPHGVLSLYSKQQLHLTGIAISEKSKHARKASLKMVNVSLPTFGPCIFFPEEA